MFAVLKDSMTVENLRLAGTTIAITGEGKEKVSVGAIAGETTGSAKITNCEVYLDCLLYTSRECFKRRNVKLLRKRLGLRSNLF